MDLKYMVLISIVTILTEVQGQYNESTVERSWGEAAEACTLATPTINFSRNKLSVELNYTLTDDVWIGYYRNKTMFEYTGCVLTGNTQYNNVSMNSPGYCLSSCGTRNPRYIGLSQNKCYCLNEEITQLSKDCGVECTAMKGVACGSNTSISLYKVAYGRVNRNSDGDCLRMEINTDGVTFSWFPCNEYLQILCTLANTTVIGIDMNFPWYQVSQKCFERNATPTTLENAMEVVNYHGPAWTGVLRSTSIYSYIPYELPCTNHQQENFGYLDNKKNVNFASITDKKRILCYTSGTTPLPENTTPTKAHTSMQSGTTSGLTSTSFAEQPTPFTGTSYKNTITDSNTNNISYATDNPEQQERKHNSGVGVPVGVSVAVIAVIVAAVTVLIVLRKRKAKSPNNELEIKTSKQREDGTNDYTEIPEIKQANGNNPLRYSTTEAQENYAHTYHVLKKDQKTDSGNDTKLNKDPQTDSHYNYPDMTNFMQDTINGHSADLGHGQYAHTYFVLEGHQKDFDSEDGTYNVSGAHKPKVEQETDNVYNKLDENNHATYDHLRKHVAKKQDSGKIYDRKEYAIRMPKPGGEPDNVYNHVPAAEESGTYDHVNNVSSDTNGAVNDCGV